MLITRAAPRVAPQIFRNGKAGEYNGPRQASGIVNYMMCVCFAACVMPCRCADAWASQRPGVPRRAQGERR